MTVKIGLGDPSPKHLRDHGAYQEGGLAFGDRLSCTENPYPGKNDGWLWQYGWLDALADRLRVVAGDIEL